MNSKVLILGAGPGGLTAAYSLLKQGINVTIIEKEVIAGGLMRAVKHKDFMVDFGYKQLYNRIPEVHELWKEILVDDFLPYKPRTGVLYKGHILEREKTFRGLRRGMPYGLLISSFADMLKYNYHYRDAPITTLEDYTYSKRGGKFTQIFSQGFDEKFKGLKWSQLPAPPSSKKKGFWNEFLSDANKSSQRQNNWFHPAKGTGQIIEILEKEIIRMGGKICLGCEVKNFGYDSGKINSVTINNQGIQTILKPQLLISSLPLQLMMPLMGIGFAPSNKELSFHRGVLMVYLFLNNSVAFPHSSIEVSCPRMLMSRITKYSAYGGRMVPQDKDCVCIEYFTTVATQLFEKSDQELYDLAIKECEKSGLLNRADCSDFLVIKNSNADPATSWADYTIDPSRKYIYDHLAKFNNLYQINRTGTDKSTYAGLMAAKAIASEDRQLFDSLTRPDTCAPWEV